MKSGAMVRIAEPGDAAALAVLGRRTFEETFVEDFAVGYSTADVEVFCARAFTVEAFGARIADPACRVWAGEIDGALVGYASAGPCALPHPAATAADGELKQLYVARGAQGRGVGRLLLDTALTWLEREGSQTLWVGVWSGNLRARTIYEAQGFAKAGEYDFPVGQTRDREFILRRG